MCPMVCGVEDLDKGGMLFLDFTQCSCLFKLGVGKTKLNFELRLNEILPRLPESCANTLR